MTLGEGGSGDARAELSTLPIFRGVSPHVLGFIDLEQMTRDYDDGEVLYSEGSDAVALFVILHGTVSLMAGERQLVSRREGEVLGEAAMVEQTPRWASAVAEGPAQALVIPREVVDQLMEDPVFLRNLAGILARKLREATSG